MKRGSVVSIVCICVILAGAAYFAYPFVSGMIEERRRGEILASSSGADTEGEIVITITEGKAEELLNAALGDGFPVTDIEVGFGDGLIVLSGTASRDALLTEELLSEHPNLYAAKLFVPESAKVGISFTASAENSEIKITPESFTLGGYMLPLGFIPEEVRNALGDIIAKKYIPEGISVVGVTVGEGILTVAAD
ncbi:MAG: hypothetical protein ACI4XQ_02950 [Eubacteriales bacterium]